MFIFVFHSSFLLFTYLMFSIMLSNFVLSSVVCNITPDFTTYDEFYICKNFGLFITPTKSFAQLPVCISLTDHHLRSGPVSAVVPGLLFLLLPHCVRITEQVLPTLKIIRDSCLIIRMPLQLNNVNTIPKVNPKSWTQLRCNSTTCQTCSRVTSRPPKT